MSENKGPTTQIVGVEMPTRIQADISLDATKALEVSLQAFKDGLSGEAGKEMDRSLARWIQLSGAAPALVLAVGSFLFNSIKRIQGPKQVPPFALLSSTMDAVKHQEPGNLLYEMFAELLARGMDKTRVMEAHPAFVEIIKVMASDEAMILQTALLKGKVEEHVLLTASPYPKDEPTSHSRQVKSGEFMPEVASYSSWGHQFPPKLSYNLISEPQHVEYINMYLRRLEGLGLLNGIIEYVDAHSSFEHTGEAILDNVVAQHVRYGWRLSSFGTLFMKACAPPEWQW